MTFTLCSGFVGYAAPTAGSHMTSGAQIDPVVVNNIVHPETEQASLENKTCATQTWRLLVLVTIVHAAIVMTEHLG